MPDDRPTDHLRGFLRVVWHLICVAMFTAFLGLVAVHDDYYSGTSSDDSLLWTALGVGVILSLVVVLRPVFLWRNSKRHQSDSYDNSA